MTMFAGSNSSTESDSEAVLPAGGTVTSFYVQLAGPPGTAKSYTFTLRHWNAAGTVETPTGVSCTITGTAVPLQCSTSSFTPVSFAAGELIDVEVDPSGNPTSQTAFWSATY